MCRIAFLDFRANFVVFTIILAAVIFVCSVIAVGTPLWIHTSNGQVSIGLFKQCVNRDCENLAFEELSECRNGSEVRDRLQVSRGVLIIALLCAAIGAMGMLFDALQCVRLTRYGRFWIFIFLIASTGFSLLTLSIVGATFENWLFCGKSLCDMIPSESCGMGYSYILAIVAAILTAIMAALYCFDTCRMTVDSLGQDARPDSHRKVFLWIAFSLLLVVVLMMIIAVATSEWYVAHAGRETLGLFQHCEGTKCTSHDFPSGTFPTHFNPATFEVTCERKGEDAMARLHATAGILFVPVVFSLGVIIFFVLLKCGCIKTFFTRCMKITFTTLAFLSCLTSALAVMLFVHTVDSWFFCGVSYCEAAATVVGGGDEVPCGKGLAFAFAVIAMVSSLLLAVMHLFELNDWLCFSNRASAEDPFGLKGSSADKVLNGSRNSPTSTELSARHERFTADGKRIPDGDWDFDAVSGYYWSDAKYRFWDPSTGLFYDPNNDSWAPTA